jgi:hypothetical protein
MIRGTRSSHRYVEQRAPGRRLHPHPLCLDRQRRHRPQPLGRLLRLCTGARAGNNYSCLVPEGLPRTKSAYKHGYTDEQTEHALHHVLRTYPDRGALGLLLIIGSTPSGEVIEIGRVDADEDGARVVHAMRARPKYWP